MEIPVEAIDAAASLSTTGRQGDLTYRRRMEDILQSALPHLLAPLLRDVSRHFAGRHVNADVVLGEIRRRLDC